MWRKLYPENPDSITLFLLYILVGFTAQMIDGAMGMAYGVSSNTFLLSIRTIYLALV